MSITWTYEFHNDEDGKPFVAYSLFKILGKLDVAVQETHLGALWMTGVKLSVKYKSK